MVKNDTTKNTKLQQISKPFNSKTSTIDKHIKKPTTQDRAKS